MMKLLLYRRLRSQLFWHCPYSMRSRVYETVRCPSLSVCPHWAHSSKPGAAGLLLCARRAGDIDRLLHGRRSAANVNSATLPAYVGSWTRAGCTGVVDGGPLHRRVSTTSRAATVHDPASVQQHRRRYHRLGRLLSAQVLREPQQVGQFVFNLL